MDRNYSSLNMINDLNNLVADYKVMSEENKKLKKANQELADGLKHQVEINHELRDIIREFK